MTGARTVPAWLRLLFRLPDGLYRHGLGWILGTRALRLVHEGRRSGRRHATVLEVIAHDPRIPEFVVISAFGARADWLRNVEANGVAEVTVGRTVFAADHRRLPLDEAIGVIGDYERRHRAVRPVVRRVLSRLLGRPYDGSPEARRLLAERLPMIALRPREA